MAAKQSKAKKGRRCHDKDTGTFSFTFLTITSFPATHAWCFHNLRTRRSKSVLTEEIKSDSLKLIVGIVGMQLPQYNNKFQFKNCETLLAVYR